MRALGRLFVRRVGWGSAGGYLCGHEQSTIGSGRSQGQAPRFSLLLMGALRRLAQHSKGLVLAGLRPLGDLHPDGDPPAIRDEDQETDSDTDEEGPHTACHIRPGWLAACGFHPPHASP